MSKNREEDQNLDAEHSSDAASMHPIEEDADDARRPEVTEDQGPESSVDDGIEETPESSVAEQALPNEIRDVRIHLEQDEFIAHDGEDALIVESVTAEELPESSDDGDSETESDPEHGAPEDAIDEASDVSNEATDSQEENAPEDEEDSASEVEDATDEGKPHNKTGAKPSLTTIAFWISLGLLVAYGLLIVLGPIFLPAGLDEAELRPGEAGHVLGTSVHGVDLFYETLKAGRQSLLQAIVPAIAGLLLIYFALPGISDPGRKDMGSLRRWLIFARLPVTVISLLLSYGFGLYYPRTWVRAGVVLFLSLTLWLPEVVVMGRYIYRYRSYAPFQSLYFLGASERNALKMRYGKPILMASAASFFRMMRMSFLILSVLPFTMDLVSVPKRADWAMSMLIPMGQGEALFVLDRWPHFIAWCLELLLLSLVIWTAERLADCHPLDNPRQVWTNIDAEMAEDLGLPLEAEEDGEELPADETADASDELERVTRDGDL